MFSLEGFLKLHIHYMDNGIVLMGNHEIMTMPRKAYTKDQFSY